MMRFEKGHSRVNVSEKDGIRSLHLGNSTVQSSMRISAPYDLVLNYSRGMMIFLLYADNVRDLLIVGLGGGSIPKYIHRYLPSIRVTVVELNPSVIAMARNQFFLPPDDDRLRVIEADGINYISQYSKPLDILVLDAFDAYGLSPELASQSFYDSSFNILNKNGILVVNLWGSDKNFDIYLQRIERTCDGRVLVMPTGQPSNVVVLGFRQNVPSLSWNDLRKRASSLQQQLPQIQFLDFVERLHEHNDHLP